MTANYWKVVAIAVAVVCHAMPAWADGWHNAALATASLDEWLRDVKTEIPDIEKKLSSASLQAGRSPEDLQELARRAAAGGDNSNPGGGGPFKNANQIQANYTPYQQSLLGRKAMDCMEIMAFMDPKNIFPREFPRFQLERIPEYRKTAKSLLAAMGPVGGQAIANQVRAELMGNSAVQQRRDIGPHDDYYKDLLESLSVAAKNGNLTPQDIHSLAEAVEGNKPPLQTKLAEAVRAVLADATDLNTLLKWHASTDNRVQQKKIMEEIQSRIAKADVVQLADVYVNQDVPDGLKRKAAMTLANRFREAPTLDLMSVLDRHQDENLSRAIQREIGQRPVSYKTLKPQLPDLLGFRRSGNRAAADAANDQLTQAFQRAPISECLVWLEVADQELSDLIWKQIDLRIARADAERLADYRKVAEQVLLLPQVSDQIKIDTLELISRLQQPQAAGAVIKALPQLNRGVWAKAGSTLAGLTGQNFGPEPGDGAAEVIVAKRKWDQWWDQNKSRFP